MARKPEITTKTDRLVFVPTSPEDLQAVEDFKKLASQDGVFIHDLMVEAIDLLFKVHHWPPGNPQRTLTSCQTPLIIVRCKCGKTAVKHGEHLFSGVERDFCIKCFSELPARHDPKVWSWSK